MSRIGAFDEADEAGERLSENLTKPDRLYTVKEMAQLLSIDEKKLYRLAKSGAIPSRRVGKSVRFLWSEVLASTQRTN